MDRKTIIEILGIGERLKNILANMPEEDECTFRESELYAKMQNLVKEIDEIYVDID